MNASFSRVRRAEPDRTKPDSFPKIPGDPEFNGSDGGALRFVGTGRDILIEDNVFAEGEIGISMGGNADANNSWSTLDVELNTSIADTSETCLIDHDGPMGQFSYASKRACSRGTTTAAS